MTIRALALLLSAAAVAAATPITLAQGPSDCGAYDPYHVQYACQPDVYFDWTTRGDTFELNATAVMEPGEFGWKSGQSLLQFALTTPELFNPDEERVDYTLQTTYTTKVAGFLPSASFEETYRTGSPSIDVELALKAFWNYQYLTGGTDVKLTASAMIYNFAEGSLRAAPVHLVGGVPPPALLLSFGMGGLQLASVPLTETPEPQAWQLFLLGGMPLVAWRLRPRRPSRPI